MSPLGSKVKLMSHNKQNAILPLVAYVRRAGFSLLQCRTAQAMLATPGFFLRHFPVADSAALKC